VVHRTLRKPRTSISENIALKVFLGDLTDRSDPLLPVVLNAVGALFQLAPTPLFGELATVFEFVLADSWIRLPANQNSYHQILPRLKTDISAATNHKVLADRSYDDMTLARPLRCAPGVAVSV
jgi:hypothetical protein